MSTPISEEESDFHIESFENQMTGEALQVGPALKLPNHQHAATNLTLTSDPNNTTIEKDETVFE